MTGSYPKPYSGQMLRSVAKTLASSCDAVLVGEHQNRPDVRPDVTQVFDLDGPRLAALAASVGIPAAVPESEGTS